MKLNFDILNVDIIFNEVKVTMEHFKDLLLTNNYQVDHLKEELEILFDHFKRYISKYSAKKCQPNIFSIGDDFGIHNLLHILEISLVALLSNAESERVLSLLWHIFSKECQSLKHDTLELLLCNYLFVCTLFIVDSH